MSDSLITEVDAPAPQANSSAPGEQLARLASIACDTPVAVIDLLGVDGRWTRTAVGASWVHTTADESVGGPAVSASDGVIITRDARTGPRWARRVASEIETPIRSLAAIAIVAGDGHPVGALCVGDPRRSRAFSSRQIDGLRLAAGLAASHLEALHTAHRMATMNDHLRRLSLRDFLTGLANRAYAEETLALGLRQRRQAQIGILFCDLDGFKQVNDRLGHLAGDELLRQTGRRLLGVARAEDLVARTGGDEFLVICPGITRASALDEFARRVVRSVAEPLTIAGETITPAISVGTAVAGPEDTGPSLIQRADDAMYEHKRRPR